MLPLSKVEMAGKAYKAAQEAAEVALTNRNAAIAEALAAGAGQTQIAFHAGVSQSTVSKIEKATKEAAL